MLYDEIKARLGLEKAMIRYSQFHLASVQAVIFTPDVGQFSQSNILATILTQYAGLFNGSVQAVPLPDEAPPELPRVILQSSNGVFKLQASPARISSHWVGFPGSNQDDAYRCTEVLETYVRDCPAQLRVGRLALIFNRVADNPNPAQALIDRFCNEASKVQPFNHSEAFEIHNQKTYGLPGFGEQVNSWVRCKAQLMVEPEHKKVVVVDQDINTLHEDLLIRNYNSEAMRRFFEATRTEADSILRIYFPEEV